MGLQMSEDKEISTSLTISDMKIINNLIELVSAKGLIRPNDFTLIGSIYEKINMVIKSSANE